MYFECPFHNMPYGKLNKTRKRQHINIVPILAYNKRTVCVCVCFSVCVAGYALLYTRKTHCVSYIKEFNINNVAPVGPQYVNVCGAHNADDDDDDDDGQASEHLLF